MRVASAGYATTESSAPLAAFSLALACCLAGGCPPKRARFEPRSAA